jgi:hypothetical protein
MLKTYKDYCREAVLREPRIYGPMFNLDGTRKPLPRMSSSSKKNFPNDIPIEELKVLEKRSWPNQFILKSKPQSEQEQLYNKPKLEISSTEFKLKGRKLDLTMMEMPKNPSRKEYNKVWMHNERVRQRIEKLKE